MSVFLGACGEAWTICRTRPVLSLSRGEEDRGDWTIGYLGLLYLWGWMCIHYRHLWSAVLWLHQEPMVKSLSMTQHLQTWNSESSRLSWNVYCLLFFIVMTKHLLQDTLSRERLFCFSLVPHAGESMRAGVWEVGYTASAVEQRKGGCPRNMSLCFC